ncbi:MAG TPA: aminopeptidase, partial [Cryomorphaceae bacterium]|nr:aminopeptidase [Cryomorphaceae bacterium]
MKRILFLLSAVVLGHSVLAQGVPTERISTSKFRQLEQELPTPNAYRTASGAPGHEYYQNKASYDMSITLDETKHRIDGSEWITYTNNSPDVLTYLWVQLDQNMRKPGSMTAQSRTSELPKSITPEQVQERYIDQFEGGFVIDGVTGGAYTIVNTMMRVDLPSPLKPGASYRFKIDWHYTINNRMTDGGRSGYEHFDEENNTLYTIAQFFPRMAVYGDNVGWQHKQFLGQGEFTLPFGDYKVSITVPEDHIVAATGVLTNESSILNATQRKRLAQARQSFDNPVIIVTEEEARAAEKPEAKAKATGKKTWIFKADNVRDFAFA